MGASRDKSATRERILEAAIAQFAQHRFSHATMRGIARHAGTSHAAVHWHFGNKPTVYAETVRIAGERFIEAVRGSGLADLPFPDAANAWIDQLDDDTAVSRLLRSLGSDHQHPTVEEAAKSVNGVFRDFWQDWLRDRRLHDGREAACTTTDIARAIVATLAGMTMVRFHAEPKPAFVPLIALVRLIDRP